MAYEPAVNKCFAFAKKKDAHPKAPDFKGQVSITEPGVYDIAMWYGEVGKETKYKGVSVKLNPAVKKAPVADKPVNLDANGNPLPW